MLKRSSCSTGKIAECEKSADLPDAKLADKYSDRELFAYPEPTGVTVTVPDAEEYKLTGNYLNRFNPAATIQFQLSESSDFILKIYNSIGEELPC